MATQLLNDDYAPDTSTSGVLLPGATLTGSADGYPDHDWLKADLTAGTAYQFTFTPEHGSSYYSYAGFQYLFNMVLRDAQGTALATQWSGSANSPSIVEYTPTASGAYYLDLDVGNVAGRYMVSMTTPPADAVPSQGAGAPSLKKDVPVGGVFDYAGDRDWYGFHVDVGQHVKFSTPLGTAADAVHASGYEFYDASGKLASYSFPFEPLVSGDYFVSVQGDSPGSYTLLMTDIKDDYAANASTAGVLQPGGGAVAGQFEYFYDQDNFRLAAQAGRTYTVKITSAATSKGQVNYGVSQADGSYVAASSANVVNGQMTFSFKAAVSGDYFVSVISAATSQGATPVSYTVQAGAGTPDDYGDDLAGATAVSLGQAVEGALQGNVDVDMLKLDLQAGVTYSLEAAAKPGGTAKAALQLQDATGQIVADDYQNASRLSYTAPASGTYYARISGADQSYVFKAVAAPDDYSANAAGAGALAIGGSTRGTMESAGDIDWLAVNLTAGVTYWFDSASTDNTDFMTYGAPGIALVDAHGDVLATRPKSYTDSAPVMQYVPAASGTYYVKVTPYGASTPPHYVVTAKIGEQDDYGATRSAAVAVQDNTPVKGRLELPEDTDMFKFAVSAGTAYVVELIDGKGTVRDNGFSVKIDSDLPLADTLRDVAGPGYAKTTLFEPQSNGDYYFTVQGDGRTSGDYTLQLTAIAGDTTAAGASTTAALQAGQPLHGVLESRYDGDWYKIPMQAGHTYLAQLQGASTGNGTLDTAQLGLSIKDGQPTAADVYRVNSLSTYSEPVLTFKPTHDGNYFVAVDAGGAAEGSYTIQVTDITNDRQAPKLISVSQRTDAPLELYDTIVLTFDERIKVGADAVSFKAGNIPVSLNSVVGNAGSQLALDNKLVIDPQGRLDPGTTYTLELKPGSITDAAGNPYSGSTSFTFTTRPYVETGTSDNDFIHGTFGKSPEILGGAGVDTVVYNVNVSLASIKGLDNGKFMVVPAYSNMGSTDTLDGVERLEFWYDHIALDIEGSAGQAYRLYQAAFNRTPDTTGVGYWIAQLDKGAKLIDVARSFVASTEFQKLYGASPSDAAFVDLLYNNVLHRAPDQAGAQYWNGALHDGLSREQALVYFSEGAENHDAVAKVIGNGFSYTPYG